MCIAWGPFSKILMTPAVEVAIRTLGVSLVAIAAVAVSLTLVRYRSEQREPGALPSPDLQPAAVDLNLEAIRTAGL